MKSLTIFIDGRQYASAKELHLALKMLFSLPEHYGCNADALYDCLTDIDEYTCIGFFGTGETDSEAGRYLQRLKRVMLDAESENPRIGVIFANTDSEDGSTGIDADGWMPEGPDSAV
jgi:ribonuclease inhibitor